MARLNRRIERNSYSDSALNEITGTSGAKFGIQLVLKLATTAVGDDTAEHCHIS